MASIKWTVSIIYQYYEKEKEYFEFLKADIENQINFDQVKYFLLKHDEKAKKAIAYTTDALGKLDDVLDVYTTSDFYADITKAEEMWCKFLKFAGDIHEAQHILIIEGHGAGLGFVTRRGMPEKFTNLPRVADLYKKLQLIFSHAQLSKEQYEKLYGSFLEEINTRFELTDKDKDEVGDIEKFGIVPVGTLLSAIRNSYNGSKLKLLYFGNCYMQTIENGYLFKDNVEYLAGTEGMYFSTGTEFKSFFAALDDGTEITELADKLCDGIEKKLAEARIRDIFINNSKDYEIIKKFFSFSVNDLSEYGELKDRVSELGEQLVIQKT